MEIPSSSPIYTPLKSDSDKNLGPDDYQLEAVRLFPKSAEITEPLSETSDPDCLPTPGDNAGYRLNIDINDGTHSEFSQQLDAGKYIADTCAEEPLACSEEFQNTTATGARIPDTDNPVSEGSVEAESSQESFPSTPLTQYTEASDHDPYTEGALSRLSRNGRAETVILGTQDAVDCATSSTATRIADNAAEDAYTRAGSSNFAYYDDDNETTILSDEDNENSETDRNEDDDETLLSQTQTQTGKPVDSQRTTQNYLEELLTESLLESLPLPPERKRDLRGLCK